MKVSGAILNLGRLDPDEEICLIEWTLEDIETLAEELEITLSPEEIDAVLRLAEHRHDANIGINWTTLTDNIKEIVSDK